LKRRAHALRGRAPCPARLSAHDALTAQEDWEIALFDWNGNVCIQVSELLPNLQ
jgi:hypothetical protein